MQSSMAYSTLDPNELAFLKRFYDNTCAEHGFEGDSLAAKDLAARIIVYYQKGARTESDLMRHLSA